jgi:hypothetical protein
MMLACVNAPKVAFMLVGCELPVNTEPADHFTRIVNKGR